MDKIVEEKFMTKNKFLNRMSHDIRTPLNAVIGYSSLLEQKAERPETVKEYAHNIKLSGHTVLSLINDFLDMNRIENGNVRLACEEFDLIQAIEEVEATVKPQSKKKKQNFFVNVGIYGQACTSTRFWGDRNKLCRLLTNLLSNAVKYTPENGHIYLEADINADGNIAFRVKDNGVGMSDEFIEKIFEPFSREEKGENEFVQGSGLGMSIVKEIVEMMAGNISVQSQEGRGTQITVHMQLKPVAKREDTYEEETTEINNQLSGMNFLIAEDNDLHGEIIMEMLALRGADCNLARNGAEVAECFMDSEPGQYDAILMDIQMPVMNGYEAVKAIRESGRPDGKSIIVIAMTANALEDDVRMAFAAGMNGHIAKPVDMTAFSNMVLTLKENTRI